MSTRTSPRTRESAQAAPSRSSTSSRHVARRRRGTVSSRASAALAAASAEGAASLTGRRLLVEPGRLHAVGLDLDDHAPLVRRAPRILVLPEVLLREPVD